MWRIDIVISLVQSMNCGPGEFYATYGKNSSGWFLYDMFSIKNGEEELYSSPVFYLGYKEYEMCLKRTLHDQYTLYLGTRSTEGSWVKGSWLLLKGIYNNTIFKLFKTSMGTYDSPIRISYYTPILKSTTWTIHSELEEGWKNYEYDDQGWSSYTSATLVPGSKGTYYARQKFKGIVDLAAYEMQVAYQFGIVVYINGFEVFRDNLPEGIILPSTVAVRWYSVADFRGVIRSNLRIRADSVLAIEIHPLSMTEPYELYYDAWLAQYASSFFSEENCYIPSIVPLIEGTGRFPETVYNYDLMTSWYDENPEKTLWMRFHNTTVLPDANGLMYIMGFGTTNTVVTDLYYKDENHTLISHETFNAESLPQAASDAFFSTPLDHEYKIVVQSKSKRMGKYMLGVCNLKKGLISYGEETLKMYMFDHYVSYVPIDKGVTNCTVTPSLPKGIHLDPVTCRLYGVATEPLERTEYTIVDHTHAVSGTFFITVEQCESVIRIYRQYTKDAAYEWFTVYNNDTGEVLYEELYDRTRRDNIYWEKTLCVNAQHIYVTLGSRGDMYWALGSYIKITKSYGEEEEVVFASSYAGDFHNNVLIETRIAVRSYSEWSYRYDSIPDHWYDDALDGWESGRHMTFPTARNQIQLYKRHMELHHLEKYISYVVQVRYQHGCVVYVNGYEVYRNHVEGEVTMDRFASDSYNITRMRSVSLPIRSMDDKVPPIDFLHEGNNTIAIALIARSADQVDTSSFDCVMRLLLPSEENRIYDCDVTYSGFAKDKDPSVLFQYYRCGFSSGDKNCKDNEIVLKLKDDRREWVSHLYMSPAVSYPLKMYTLYARNHDEEEWVLLGSETKIYYKERGDVFTWFKTSKSFNQFRIVNIHGEKDLMSQCPFMVSYLSFHAHSMMDEVSDLQYPPLSFLPQESFTIYPLITYYYHRFSIQPALPEGINLLDRNGMFYGRVEEAIPPTPYTVSAFRYSGREVNVAVTLMTKKCAEGEVLVSAYVPNFMSAYIYIYEGIGAQGKVLLKVPSFEYSGTWTYELCLPDLVCTLKIGTNSAGGWTKGGHIRLIYEEGTFTNDIIYLPRCPNVNCYRYYTFSSSYAFRNLYSPWRVLKTVPSKEWTSLAYDDSAWTSTLLPNLEKNEAVTTYLRYVLNITNADYRVINIRIGYTGGVIAYFNSRVVARYNLEASPDPSSQPSLLHNKEAYSMFHVTLLHDNAEVGRNILAVEIHRSLKEVSSTPVFFNAVGVYGMNLCSYAVDSFSSVTSTPPLNGAILDAFTWPTKPSVTIPMANSTFIEWESENLEGSVFNAFGFYSTTTNPLLSGRLFGYDDTIGSYLVNSYWNDRHDEREMKEYLADMAVSPHRKYRFQITNSSESEMTLHQFYFLYCQTEGTPCKEMGPFPSVYSGQKSPARCEYGYKGFSYRMCANGVFGDPHTENCRYLKPENLTYDQSTYLFMKGLEVEIKKPTYGYIINQFSLLDSTLPDGFSLDSKTGAIYGIATEVVKECNVTIIGSNPVGSVTTSFQITVTPCRCEGGAMFYSVEAGQIAKYSCRRKGFYSGVLTRKCMLTPEGGKWDSIEGECVSRWKEAGWVIGVGVVLFAVLAFVLFYLRRRKVKKVKQMKCVAGYKVMICVCLFR